MRSMIAQQQAVQPVLCTFKTRWTLQRCPYEYILVFKKYEVILSQVSNSVMQVNIGDI